MPLLDRVLPRPTPQDAVELQPEHLDAFRRSQRMAYECVMAVEAQLRPGMTEKDATARIDGWFKDHGVRQYFHQPFAWFGERTAFDGHRTVLDFFATSRRLEPGAPVILDVAPVVDGHASDIGYSCRIGDNPLHDQMMLDLAPYRTLIVDGVRAKRTMRDIYAEVDGLIERQGYKNRHRQYPFRVLAHRVNYLAPADRMERKVAGFGVPALGYLLGRVAEARTVADRTPIWNDSKQCDRPVAPGLWAVEPHLGFRGIGVKWEELLVVTDADAFWLDDDLPHVRRFERLRSAHLAAVAPRAPGLRAEVSA